jgi:hypothetical protein
MISNPTVVVVTTASMQGIRPTDETGLWHILLLVRGSIIVDDDFTPNIKINRTDHRSVLANLALLYFEVRGLFIHMHDDMKAPPIARWDQSTRVILLDDR